MRHETQPTTAAPAHGKLNGNTAHKGSALQGSSVVSYASATISVMEFRTIAAIGVGTVLFVLIIAGLATIGITLPLAGSIGLALIIGTSVGLVV